MKSHNTSGPQGVRRSARLAIAVASLVLAGATIERPTRALAADHRDSPTADSNPEGDITDLFAFLDPNDPTQLVLIMNVSPFSVPDEPNYAFSTNTLYQIQDCPDPKHGRGSRYSGNIYRRSVEHVRFRADGEYLRALCAEYDRSTKYCSEPESDRQRLHGDNGSAEQHAGVRRLA